MGCSDILLFRREVGVNKGSKSARVKEFVGWMDELGTDCTL